jgi:hypothetical protein
MNQRNAIPTEAEPIDDGFSEATPGDLLAAGKSLMKAGTPFVTAMSVQKPRDLDRIVKAIAREAEYAGDSFYYGWGAGGSRIEGPSIGLANSLAREWKNCAVTCALQETDEAFYITARFIDLENGSQMERIFRQRKNAVQGKYDADRKLDMALQIGQSKAIRNVVVNSVPRWLVDQAIEQAKAAVLKGIDPKKLDEWKGIIVSEFAAFKVTEEMLVAKTKKPLAEWTTRDIAGLKGDLKALKNGEINVAELFPREDGEVKPPAGPLTGKTIGDAILKDVPAGEDPVVAKQRDLDKAKAAQQGGGPSRDEQARIAQREAFEAKKFQCSICPPYTFATDSLEESDVHMQTKHPQPPTQQTKPADPKKGGGDLFGKK